MKKIIVINCLICIVFFIGCSHMQSIVVPGKISQDKILLSNGWKLSPAGEQIGLGDLPLNMTISPDGAYAAVTNNGQGKNSLQIVDVQLHKIVQTIVIPKLWLGITFYDKGKKIALSGGNDSKIYLFNFRSGHAELADSIVLGNSWPKDKIWLSGISVDDNEKRLYVTGKQNDELLVIDLNNKKLVKRMRLDAKPYTCLVSHKNHYVYVSLWGGEKVILINKNSLQIEKTISVGSHPNDIIESSDGKYLYVPNGNQNTVSVIDIDKGSVIETLNTALLSDAPPGSTPNGVALSNDNKKLFIANADNNCLCVMDVSNPGHSKSLGFIPTGWYPTTVRTVPGEDILLVTNGKGGTSKANPHGPNPYQKDTVDEYIGRLLLGTLSKIAIPTETELGAYSKQVYENSPSPNSAVNGSTNQELSSILSPIQHVIYIIKENRTYDQVFGDIKEGNGDSTLCLFPESVTPNAHALVKQFVLLDNFYADAEVSADGHNWSNGAYATDFVEKSWPTSYGHRGGDYEFEGGYPIAYPQNGYMWDNCKRNNKSYRSYGEFAHNGKSLTDDVTASIESLEGHVAPHYRSWDLDYSDVERVKCWIKEFEDFEKNGDLPQFQVIKLSNDHTSGTRKNNLSPKAYVAQNDLALGMIVSRLSQSKYWKNSAVFIVEDDAQDGADHVDAHRTVAMVASPYNKRGFVDHTMYSTSSMLRTMEMILGLPPMSQYDASATPMLNSFRKIMDTTGFSAIDHRYNIFEKNIAGAYGQERSEDMDFSREDAIEEASLNEILWKSIRGAGSRVPAPVRSAFVRVKNDDEDE